MKNTLGLEQLDERRDLGDLTEPSSPIEQMLSNDADAVGDHMIARSHFASADSAAQQGCEHITAPVFSLVLIYSVFQFAQVKHPSVSFGCQSD
jgi:hypothetical protein